MVTKTRFLCCDHTVSSQLLLGWEKRMATLPGTGT